MTEEILEKIRTEASVELAILDKYNAYAKLRNELALVEEVKKSFGLPYIGNMCLPEKTEHEVIMSIYKKYIGDIKVKDTNEIYVYYGTYMKLDLTPEEIEDGYPFEQEVEKNDPRATHRYYGNLECLWTETVPIDECLEFENTHIVLYAEDFYEVEKEFIMTAVKENQEKALSKVLSLYKK